MKAEFYYHYPFFGDVLLVDLDSEAIPTAYQRDGDVVTVFSEGRIVGVNLVPLFGSGENPKFGKNFPSSGRVDRHRQRPMRLLRRSEDRLRAGKRV